MRPSQQLFAAAQCVAGLLVAAAGFAFAIAAVKAESGGAMIFAWAVLFMGTYLVLDVFTLGE